jgi:phosphoglycolate phosphatase-like HAD superfamily hydrolase
VTDSPLLDGIDLVVLDKDGTLIDFDAMWGGWARELGARLEASSGRPVSGDLFTTLGFDPTTGRVAPGGPLATGTMGGIRELTTAVLRRWCPSVAAARRAAESAWFEPDPVALAVPLADLPALFGELADSGRQIAVATTDDREPTDATLVALGVRHLVGALACGDDGFPVKPAPDAVLALCQVLRVDPGHVAVVGDTPADLRMGRAAGAGRVIGVLSGLGREADLAALADALLPSVADLVPSR